MSNLIFILIFKQKILKSLDFLNFEILYHTLDVLNSTFVDYRYRLFKFTKLS